MSKLETVRRLKNTGPQLQIVESVVNLQTEVQELKQSLNSLPQAIANETAKALEPLSQLQQNLDTVTAAQRATLEDLTREIASSAAQSIEQKAASLDQTLTRATASTQALATQAQGLADTLNQVTTLPDQLKAERGRLLKASEALRNAAEKFRPKPWRQVMALIMAGLVAGFLVLGGQAVLSKQAQLSEEQVKLIQDGQALRQVWSTATEDERKLIRDMLQRPAP